MCGLEHADFDDDAQSSESRHVGFHELTSAIQQYYGESCAEHLDLERRPTEPALASITENGLYNRAAIFAQRTWRYTARLHGELMQLVEKTPDEELDQSALVHLFPHTELSRQAESDLDHHPDGRFDGQIRTNVPEDDVAELEPLNRAQFEACRHATTATHSVVTGPPGTGKSRVVANILANTAISGGSALFASRNHQALEAVVPRLNACVEPDCLVLRLTQPAERMLDDPLLTMLGDLLHKPRPAHVLDEIEDKQARMRHASERLRQLRQRIHKVHELEVEIAQEDITLQALVDQLPAAFEERIRNAPKVPAAIEIKRSRDRLCLNNLRWWSWSSWRNQIRWLIGRKRILEEGVEIHRVFSAMFPEHRAVDTVDPVEPRRAPLANALSEWLPIATAIEQTRVVVRLRRARGAESSLEELSDNLPTTYADFHEQVAATLKTIASSYGTGLDGEEPAARNCSVLPKTPCF